MKEFIIHLFHSLFSFIFLHKRPNYRREKYKLIVWYYYATSWVYALSDNLKMARSMIRMKNISESKIGISEELALSYAAFGGLLMAGSFFEKANSYYKKAIKIAESFQVSRHHLKWAAVLFFIMAVLAIVSWQGKMVFRQLTALIPVSHRSAPDKSTPKEMSVRKKIVQKTQDVTKE